MHDKKCIKITVE